MSAEKKMYSYLNRAMAQGYIVNNKQSEVIASYRLFHFPFDEHFTVMWNV